MRLLAAYPVLRIVIACCALLLGGWILNGFMQGSRNIGLTDLIEGNPAIATSFELEVEKAIALSTRLKADLATEETLDEEWVDKLSEANILLIAVKDWSQMVFFENVPGLEEVAKSSRNLKAHDYREIHILSESGRVIIVVIAYMVPGFDTWAFDCISRDFVDVLTSVPVLSEGKLGSCIENGQKDYGPDSLNFKART